MSVLGALYNECKIYISDLIPFAINMKAGIQIKRLAYELYFNNMYSCIWSKRDSNIGLVNKLDAFSVGCNIY